MIRPILRHRARNLDGYADYLGRLSAPAGTVRTTRNVGSRYRPIEPETGGSGSLRDYGASLASAKPWPCVETRRVDPDMSATNDPRRSRNARLVIALLILAVNDRGTAGAERPPRHREPASNPGGRGPPMTEPLPPLPPALPAPASSPTATANARRSRDRRADRVAAHTRTDHPTDRSGGDLAAGRRTQPGHRHRPPAGFPVRRRLAGGPGVVAAIPVSWARPGIVRTARSNPSTARSSPPTAARCSWADWPPAPIVTPPIRRGAAFRR